MASGLAEVRRGAGLKDRHLSKTAGIKPYKLAQNFKYFYDGFDQRVHSSLATGAATGGATGNVNVMDTGYNQFEYHVKGAGQTITTPVLEADGLEIALDKTDNEGAEYTLGILSRNKAAFTVGTHSFYAIMQLKIADVSGTDDCCFGFRKAEPYQANVDDYDEATYLNVELGTIKIETILNNPVSATVVNTTNTVADGGTVTLGVFVDLGGNVRYEINGAAPIVTTAFKFDNGEVVVPFFFFLQATTSPGKVHLQEFECGLREADVR